jgi:HSP20 family molecular chaperone IbpA
MALKKEKEKIAIVPKEKTKIIERKPYDLWMDMDRLFDHFLSNFDELSWGSETSFMTSSDVRIPAMDVVDLGDKFEMRIEMPGVKKRTLMSRLLPHQ